MPHGPKGEAVLYVRLPKDTRDAVARAAQDAGISINAWCARTLHEATHHATPHDALQHTTQHDTTPHATHHITVVDVIRNITQGHPLIAPCGRTWPCTETQGTTTIAGQNYCTTCNIRQP